MGKKKQTITHSQTLGIIWISAALLLIAAVVFFSSRRAPDMTSEEATKVERKEFLTVKEDSVYRSYNQKRHNKQRNNRYRQENTSFYTTVAPTPTKQPLAVELNGADTLTLQLLHGIGPAYAHRIVRYREKLGGFVCTDQLLEVYGFTPELLDHIRPFLTLDTTVLRHININTIELKQLARHPYMEYYQARDIVRLRTLGTRFHSVDDLRAIPSMADSTLLKITPYLDFSDSL